jgi:hypothetical protein
MSMMTCPNITLWDPLDMPNMVMVPIWNPIAYSHYPH